MSAEKPAQKPVQNAAEILSAAKPFLSLDTWAVILSLALALFVRIGLIKSVAW